MKQYIDKDTCFQFGEQIIPKQAGNRHYDMLVKEVAEGIAEIVPFIPVLTATDYSAAAQNVLDEQARLMGYDSIFTAISYEGDPHKEFNDEAVALKNWRSAVWVSAYSTLAQVENGDMEQPSIEEFLLLLPVFGG